MRLKSLLAAALLLLPLPLRAEVPEKPRVVASFSILGDLVREVGGDKVDVQVLVGPNGDVHAFQPTPANAQALKKAKLIVVNGLGLEGWMTRLIASSGSRALVVVASQGVKSIEGEEDGKKGIDPHAWQSVANAKIYAVNIRDGLSAADPADAAYFKARAEDFLARLDATEAKVRADVAQIPEKNRRIVTTHDAFGYFAAAYGFEFLAPQGISTDSEPSAKDIAALIAQIKREKIPAVFLENISDPRLMKRIGEESGAKIGGDLFSDALSANDGPAPTYIDMMNHNMDELKKALVPHS
ncbi:zinc/manganese transport system substrate-binding protein [Rhodoblastus acidophilus]|uniref:metal ABC transporter substrate-binding protein n=1 Tax=Rhodoblastus acidophilus TaxID=1074 RepID=UPI002224E1C0|nr:metal ABC transporter substrate-binding protein [Rhodoblastus acidophilus]MCW2282714.1 zinc/manganese transport system substrate-binding protein [Rhodoblastus acidophilus]MCW2331575.1 zinc/manganese transport system substrate-binding protein [Rhodoblastus acidophilus]